MWAFSRMPVGASGEGQYLCKCLVGHCGTSLKRLGAVEIVPWKVGMIKTEKVEREYGEGDWVILKYSGIKQNTITAANQKVLKKRETITS